MGGTTSSRRVHFAGGVTLISVTSRDLKESSKAGGAAARGEISTAVATARLTRGDPRRRDVSDHRRAVICGRAEPAAGVRRTTGWLAPSAVFLGIRWHDAWEQPGQALYLEAWRDVLAAWIAKPRIEARRDRSRHCVHILAE